MKVDPGATCSNWPRPTGVSRHLSRRRSSHKSRSDLKRQSLARFVSRGVTTAPGQQLAVENKPGASGNIAAGEVHCLGNPYRLLVANSGLTINPYSFSTTSPIPTEFTPIGLILESQLVLCVNAPAPAKNFQEFIAWIKAKSGKGFSYAFPGSGGDTHLSMEYFRERASLPSDLRSRDRQPNHYEWGHDWRRQTQASGDSD